MSSSSDLQDQLRESFADTGNSFAIQATLSGTPGTITTIEIPNSAKGFMVHSASADIIFDVYQSAAAAAASPIAAEATSSSTSIALAALSRGGLIKSGDARPRLVPPLNNVPNTRVIALRSATASAVIEIEFFSGSQI